MKFAIGGVVFLSSPSKAKATKKKTFTVTDSCYQLFAGGHGSMLAVQLAQFKALCALLLEDLRIFPT